MKLLLILGLLITQGCFAREFIAADIWGIWQMDEFVIVKGGQKINWCEGATGSLAYFPGRMSVGINCKDVAPESQADKLGGILFYSGYMEVIKGEVIHRSRNFSHPSLEGVFKRKIGMSDENHLTLSGLMTDGSEVLLKWTRKEKFSNETSENELHGIYELVGSENEVNGKIVPFCTGFNGTIYFTPGGHTGVSINCGKKADESEVEIADQFKRRYFYNGTFTLEGTKAFQLPQNASEVNHIGVPAVRESEIKGDILTLSGMNGAKFVAKWRKIRGL